MTVPIAVQLYSFREALGQDFEGVIRRVAGMGYIGVETAAAALASTTPSAAAVLFRSLNLKVMTAHSALPLGENQAAILDTIATLGTDTLICPWLDPEKYFQSEDGIKQACDLLNEANQVCRAHGLTLGYHNHWFEFKQFNGRYSLDLLREGLAPEIIFEIDTYWAKTAGADPVRIIREFGARAPLLHLKDGPCTRDDPNVALGEGGLPIRPLVQDTTKWLIVELDKCATDMLDAVEKSYTYLVGEHLGYGNKS